MRTVVRIALLLDKTDWVGVDGCYNEHSSFGKGPNHTLFSHDLTTNDVRGGMRVKTCLHTFSRRLFEFIVYIFHIIFSY
jgi:hypothetical protein